MPDPISFPSTTRHTDLPLLFAGQSQKEFFLNQSLVTIDALLIRSVESVLNAPPENALEGDCYLVGATPTGDWTGQGENLAIGIGESWTFVEPIEGMELFDRAAGHKLIYRSQWFEPIAPSQLEGGAVVDVEARAFISALANTLKTAGILAEPV